MDAEIVREALWWGWRVNLSTVIEVVRTQSSSELHSIKQAYSFRHNSKIEEDIAHKTNGNFKEILLTVVK
ncbi:Annexin D1 [Camellia lanceoleosa]|uniref:Annexin D1 n=1 Tax=Camellia lanceoleosa TaxID=1840588 RepID=A0ACC0IVY4_9ERIC|nr:Annexin D1 [Camellia lanceoleosa]